MLTSGGFDLIKKVTKSYMWNFLAFSDHISQLKIGDQLDATYQIIFKRCLRLR